MRIVSLSTVRAVTVGKRESTLRRNDMFTLVLVFFAFYGMESASATEPVAIAVGQSSLPRGNGLAATVADTKALTRNPAVIFADDFETGKLGETWDQVQNRNGDVLSLVSLGDDNAPASSRSLMVAAHLGQDTGGGLTKWFPSTRDLFVRFYTRFARRSDYIHHFVTLRANRGLTGGDRWSGFGGAGERPKGDQRFSTALEPWGNWRKWPPPGKWNFYSYWHEMKGSPGGKYWGNSFRSDEQPNILKDQWICCEFLLRHNTPGQTDGEQAYWIDGELRGHWTGFGWRTDEKLQANSLALESYVTQQWTSNRVNVVYFDNVVIASTYIGPEPSR